MSHALDIVIALTGLVVVGFVLGVGAYVLGSFLLMSRHTPARQLGASMRELVREAVLAALVQPLLPLFYLVGHRMDRLLVWGSTTGLEREGAARVPIVFVHGYMQNRVGFIGLARALAQKGFGPIYAINYPWFASLEGNAARLERFVARVCEQTESACVDLVCHSMGGLVAMEMMRNEAHRAKLRVRRCVTIATPHAGVMWRGPMLGVGAARLRRGSKLLEAHAGEMTRVPCMSIFSSHDNIVHPKETSRLAERGGRDVEIEGVAHLSILFTPQVAAQVAAFLSEPDEAAASSTVGVGDAVDVEGGEASAESAPETDSHAARRAGA